MLVAGRISRKNCTMRPADLFPVVDVGHIHAGAHYVVAGCAGLFQSSFNIPQSLKRLGGRISDADDSSVFVRSGGSGDMNFRSNSNGARISNDWFPRRSTVDVLSSHARFEDSYAWFRSQGFMVDVPPSRCWRVCCVVQSRDPVLRRCHRSEPTAIAKSNSLRSRRCDGTIRPVAASIELFSPGISFCNSSSNRPTRLRFKSSCEPQRSQGMMGNSWVARTPLFPIPSSRPEVESLCFAHLCCAEPAAWS